MLLPFYQDTTFFFIPYLGNNDNSWYIDTLRKERKLSLLPSSTVRSNCELMQNFVPMPIYARFFLLCLSCSIVLMNFRIAYFDNNFCSLYHYFKIFRKFCDEISTIMQVLPLKFSGSYNFSKSQPKTCTVLTLCERILNNSLPL